MSKQFVVKVFNDKNLEDIKPGDHCRVVNKANGDVYLVQIEKPEIRLTLKPDQNGRYKVVEK